MKVLWITNTLFPEAQGLLIGDKDFKSSGGWLIGSSEMLSKTDGISLVVSTMSKMVDEITILKGERIDYVILPFSSNPLSEKYKKILLEVRDSVAPDLIHIHGTEHPFGLSYIKACGPKNVVVSIQGMISEIAKYYLSGISRKDIIKNFTLRDLLYGSIISEKRNFIQRGKYEIECLSSVNHVIGRTTFDHDHSLSINQNLHYYFCNETLRPEFYTDCWNYDTCAKHSIFLSQASYPIKGLHTFLRALPIVLKKYPDTTVYIAGFDLTCRNGGILRKILIPGYGLMIRRIMDKFGLNGIVQFTGALNAAEMKEQLLRSNLFVCPSSIENSPNSLGEAQLLGVPCVGSYAGGIPDMIPDKTCGLLYRYEDYEMLAQRIIDVFEDLKSLDNSNMRQVARERHSQEKNLLQQVHIYKQILGE